MEKIVPLYSPFPCRKHFENFQNKPKIPRPHKIPLNPKYNHLDQASENEDNIESFLYKREGKRKSQVESNGKNYNNYPYSLYKNKVNNRKSHCHKPPSYVKLRELLKKAKQELIKDHFKCKASKNQEIRREYFKYLKECYQNSFRGNEDDDFSEKERVCNMKQENMKNLRNIYKSSFDKGKENSAKTHAKKYNSIRSGNECLSINTRNGKSLNTEKYHDKILPYKLFKSKYIKESPEINSNCNNLNELKYKDELKRNSHQLRLIREEQQKSVRKFRFLEAKCRELERSIFQLDEFKPRRIAERNSRNQNEYRSLGYDNQLYEDDNNKIFLNSKKNNHNINLSPFKENENSEKALEVNNIRENNLNNLLLNSKLLKRPSESMNHKKKLNMDKHQNAQAYVNSIQLNNEDHNSKLRHELVYNEPDKNINHDL